jgi:phosphoribosylglycinamide formyltransferase 1
MHKRKRITVFASGFGSNLQAIIDYGKSNDLNGDIALVLSNKKDARALDRARENGIKAVFINPSEYNDRRQYDARIIELLESEEIDLIVLAGYMLILSDEFVSKFRNKILNIHPALLPSFKGTHGIRDAFDYGVKVTGVTVHFLEEDLDSGPIIIQKPVDIEEDDSMEKLESRIHRIEHHIYPLAVKYFCEDRLKIEGRKVRILRKENINGE